MTEKHDRVTGPIPREKFRELGALPFGAATKEIRKFDPLYGYPEGTKISWLVTFTATVQGCANVTAATKEEAKKLAQKLDACDVEWEEPEDFDLEIEKIEAEGVVEPEE